MKRLFALALLVLGFGGCFGSKKNPVKIVRPPTSTWLAPSTPQAVLNNLIKSYSERDSTHYRACYDPAYQGQSYDGNGSLPGNQPTAYTFDDESAHIAALQRSASIYHVALDLANYQSAPMQTIAGDPPGWTTVDIYNPKVQIDDASGSIGIAAGEVFEFKFAPTLDNASPTDTTWAIIRWTEIGPVP